MSKIKFLLATLCCVFVMGKTNAQSREIRFDTGLKVVWDGAPGYRPNTTFTFKATKGQTVLSNIFTGPGTWMPPTIFGGNNSIGTIQGFVNSNFWFTSTYNDYYTNVTVVGGGESATYIDTWNGKVWYLYASKATATEWHWRIGQ